MKKLILSLLLATPLTGLAKSTGYCGTFDVSIKNYLPGALAVIDATHEKHVTLAPDLRGQLIGTQSTVHIKASSNKKITKHDNLTGEIILQASGGRVIRLPYALLDKRKSTYVSDVVLPGLSCNVERRPAVYPQDGMKIETRWFPHHVEYKIQPV